MSPLGHQQRAVLTHTRNLPLQMCDLPLVSVIIPTFNRDTYLKESIQSVLNQTYPSLQIIVIDDGSTDQTENVVMSVQAKQQVIYHKIPRSGNVSRIRNIGLKIAQGSYFAFIDSDDVWHPDKLTIQMELLTRQPAAFFCFCMIEQFGPAAIDVPDMPKYFMGDFIHEQLIRERFVAYPSAFIARTEVLLSCGYLDESLIAGETDFFMRIAATYAGIFTGEKLARIRKHSNNTSLEHTDLFNKEHAIMLRKFNANGIITTKQFDFLIARQYYRTGISSLAQADFSKAIAYFLKHILKRPFNLKSYFRVIQCLMRFVIRPHAKRIEPSLQKKRDP